MSDHFHVVFRNTSGSMSQGAITWTSFESEKEFDEWYDQKMQGWYHVVEKGVSQERAIELYSGTEATNAVLANMRAEVDRLCQRIIEG